MYGAREGDYEGGGDARNDRSRHTTTHDGLVEGTKERGAMLKTVVDSIKDLLCAGLLCLQRLNGVLVPYKRKQ